MSINESGAMGPRAGYRTDAVAAEAQRAPEGTKVRLAGRLVLWRKMGGLIFGQLQDRSGRVQLSLSKKDLGIEVFKEWSKSVKIGDFIGVAGSTYITLKGESTVAVSDLVVLSRTMRSMPDKWLGMSNVDSRYRRRYLDLLVNTDSRERFQTRARIIRRIRQFLDDNDFLEIETPILQESASGAAQWSTACRPCLASAWASTVLLLF